MLRIIRNLLYRGIPARFDSDFPLEDSVRRLREATKRSVFSELTRQSAVGTVSERKVKLQRVIPFFGNSWKPIFIGEFLIDHGRVVLDGQFTMFTSTKVFNTIWFGFAIVWTLLSCFFAVGTAVAPNLPPDVRLTVLFPLIGIAFICVGLLMVRFGWWSSRGDIAYLSNVIKQALTAT